MEFVKIEDLISYQIKGLWGEEFDDSFHCTPVIKTNNMNYDGTIDLNNLTYRNIKHDSILENYLQKGDLLIEKSGGTKTHSVGYVTYFDGEEKKYVCNNFILGLRPDTTKINSKYLFYNLKYMYENGNFSDCYNKTTGIQNLKVKFYLAKKIKLIEFSKQNEIIEVLDIITKQINSLKSVLENFDNIVKSQFIEMFGDINRGEFKYEKIMLEDVCEKSSSNLQINKLEDNDGIYPLYGASGLVKKIDFYCSDSDYLGVVKDGSGVGKIFFLEKYSSLVGTMEYIYPNDKITIRFLEHTMKNLNLADSVSGVAIPHIYFKNYSKKYISLPPKDMQFNFENLINQIDKSKFIVQKQIKLLEELLEKKMNEYFGN